MEQYRITDQGGFIVHLSSELITYSCLIKTHILILRKLVNEKFY